MTQTLTAQTWPLAIGGVRACVIIPAFQAASSVGAVIDEVRDVFACDRAEALVVDDGSTDDTTKVAREAGALVVTCSRNRGKGSALVRGLEEAHALGFGVAVTVDADGQHPALSARELITSSDDPATLVLGVRDLARDGAPSKNQFSNGVSNFFLSRFTGRPLRDTQCGLRRYPVAATLALQSRAEGYAFEAEVIIRAIRAGIPILEHPVRVIYPPESERVTHFDSVRDPMRIVATVVRTLHDLRHAR